MLKAQTAVDSLTLIVVVRFMAVIGIVQLVKTLGNTSFEREDEEVNL